MKMEKRPLLGCYPLIRLHCFITQNNVTRAPHHCVFILYTSHKWGTQWRSWLRHCATSRKVAGLIPDGITGIFHFHNSSVHIMALGLTQPLTEMSTRNVSWGGVGGRQPVRRRTFPPSCVPIVLKSGSLNLLEPSGPVQACNGIALPLPSHHTNFVFIHILVM
jgi:hypothetical protein